MYSNDIYPENDYRAYLQHHGVKGQHWGERNGPPYPLSPQDHSSSERKAGWKSSLESPKAKGIGDTLKKLKNQKEFVGEIQQTRGNNLAHIADSIKPSIEQRLDKSQKEKLSKLNKSYREANSAYDDKFDAEILDNDKLYKKAYDDTFKWFQEHESDYLKDIIAKNGGSKKNLDDFHDFRKAFDGELDSVWSKAETNWLSDKSNKALYDAKNRAQAERDKYVDELMNDMIGKNKKKKLSTKRNTVGEAVRYALNDI